MENTTHWTVSIHAVQSKHTSESNLIVSCFQARHTPHNNHRHCHSDGQKMTSRHTTVRTSQYGVRRSITFRQRGHLLLYVPHPTRLNVSIHTCYIDPYWCVETFKFMKHRQNSESTQCIETFTHFPSQEWFSIEVERNSCVTSL